MELLGFFVNLMWLCLLLMVGFFLLSMAFTVLGVVITMVIGGVQWVWGRLTA